MQYINSIQCMQCMQYINSMEYIECSVKYIIQSFIVCINAPYVVYIQLNATIPIFI